MGKIILVVDDDAMNLRMAEMILKKKGYDVKKADSGQEALALLQHDIGTGARWHHERYDIIHD